jgi:hypothetical protein
MSVSTKLLEHTRTIVLVPPAEIGSVGPRTTGLECTIEVQMRPIVTGTRVSRVAPAPLDRLRQFEDWLEIPSVLYDRWREGIINDRELLDMVLAGEVCDEEGNEEGVGE